MIPMAWWQATNNCQQVIALFERRREEPPYQQGIAFNVAST